MCRARAWDDRFACEPGAPPPGATPTDATPITAALPTVDAAPRRIGDHERQQVADELRLHFTEGRLDVDEFSSRLDEVWRAETTSDLQDSLRQLPPIPGRPRPWAAPGIPPGQTGWVFPTRSVPRRYGRPVWVNVALAIVALWVAFALWPLWLVALAVWLVFVRPHRRRRDYGWYY